VGDFILFRNETQFQKKYPIAGKGIPANFSRIQIGLNGVFLSKHFVEAAAGPADCVLRRAPFTPQVWKAAKAHPSLKGS
jgi:hypothetical protein